MTFGVNKQANRDFADFINECAHRIYTPSHRDPHPYEIDRVSAYVDGAWQGRKTTIHKIIEKLDTLESVIGPEYLEKVKENLREVLDR